jgi:hypothetical protein
VERRVVADEAETVAVGVDHHLHKIRIVE